MSNFKRSLTYTAVSSLTLLAIACAIPEPGQKEIAKKEAGPQLQLSSSQEQAKLISEDFDSEIAIATGKKVQFTVCLQSNDSSKQVSAGDIVVMSSNTETRDLKASTNGCVSWQESVETINTKVIELKRKFEIKDKFSNALDVMIQWNMASGESSVEIASNKPAPPASAQEKITLLDQKATEAYELGFESLTLKAEKKADDSRSFSLEGTPTLEGELLRYAKVKGHLIFSVSTDGKNRKPLQTMNVEGRVRDGLLSLKKIDNNQLKCDQGQIFLEVQLSALSKKHNVKTFRELHALKSCSELEGAIELSSPL